MRIQFLIVFMGILNFAGAQMPKELRIVGDVLYFVLEKENGDQLWKTDGECLFLVKECNIQADCDFGRLMEFKNQLFFATYDNNVGVGLWKSDGTTEGTQLVKSGFAGNSGGNLLYFTVVNDLLFFVASEGLTGRQLWKSDGTTEGTSMVKQIAFNSTVSNPITGLTSFNDILLFTFFDTNILQTDLWKSDGTAEGTVKIKAFPGPGGGAANLKRAGDFVYFKGSDATNGAELWKTDGTSVGTVMVKDIYPGTTGSIPTELANSNSLIYFSANHPTYGRELWKSDGTAQGTAIVKDIQPGTGNGSPYNLMQWNGNLYFASWDGGLPAPLWKTDGTDLGTIKLYDFERDNQSNIPSQFTVANNLLYFTGNDGVTGTELWKTDGSAAGTELVIDTRPSGNGAVRGLTSFDNALYFTADNNMEYSLWRTTGTLAATNPIVIEQKSNCQFISFPLQPNRTLGEQPFNLAALASSGLAVTYSSSSTNIQLDGSQVTMIASGPVSITAQQDGTVDFNAAIPVSRTFCVNPATPIISKKDGVENVLESDYDMGNQWYLNGLPIDGETNSTLIVQDPGQYTVQVENEGCASQFSNVIDIVITGIEGELLNFEELVFPNPTKHRLLINGQSEEINVYGAAGKQIRVPYLFENGVTEINCESLSEGLYILQFKFKGTNKIFRFIKN